MLCFSVTFFTVPFIHYLLIFYDKNASHQSIFAGFYEIIVWTDYEQAKAYFLEMMMTAEGEERDRAECVYIQLIHGLSECSDEDE